LAGEVTHEHRTVAVCFVEFSGVDALRAAEGLDAVRDAVATVVDACQNAAEQHDVMFLSSDIYPDGGKVILVAGAPRNTGDDATRARLDACRTPFHTVALEPFAVKGKSALIQASLVGQPVREYQARGTDLPMVGRAEELAVLTAAWARAEAGHGSLVELVGDP